MSHHEDDHDSPDLTKVIEKLTRHIDTRMEYLKLLISEKLAITISKTASVFILLLLFILFFLFINIAAALWIGKYYNNYAIGFGAISGFYLLLILIYAALKKSFFEKKMQDMIVNSVMENEEEEDEDE
jgi:hypothetical protein